MKHHDKRTGETTILCPKLLIKEERKKEKEEQATRKAEIARIEAEEKTLLEPIVPPTIASEIVVPQYSQFYTEKIDYWHDSRFEPLIPPMHCPFSTHC
tara:strand:+ start:257 stop:550 length:294 start_codon:yes stop_codon:yes gene_type:complete